MKILITGGAGFIGSQLCFYLMKKNHKITLLDNLTFGYKDNLRQKNNQKSNLNFIQMDIRDKKIEKVFKKVDIVFHLAGISSLPECQADPGEAYQVNVAGTANVLETARISNVKRVIFSSSSAVYENETKFPTVEDYKSQPDLIYSLSKKHAEEICNSYKKIYGMDIVILRFFNVYGPHMDFKRPNPPLVSYIIKCLLEKKSPILHSNGKQSRDMIFIDDVLSLCEKVIKSKRAKNQVFNVASEKSYSVEDIYSYISSLFGLRNIKPIFVEHTDKLWYSYPNLFKSKYPLSSKYIEKEVNKHTQASIKKAIVLLGWKPKVSLLEGLRKTVNYEIGNK